MTWYYHPKLDIYATGFYLGTAGKNIHGYDDQGWWDFSRRIRRFKLYGHHTEQITTQLAPLQQQFSDIVIVPPNRIEKTSTLQSLYGNTLERVKTVSKRTYVHHAHITQEYYDSLTLHTERLTGTSICLLDDICATGKSLHACQQMFPPSYTVTCCALAFSLSLFPECQQKHPGDI